MRLLSCFGGGKKRQTTVVPVEIISIEQEQDNNVEPERPPNQERRSIYVTSRERRTDGIFRLLPVRDLLDFSFSQLLDATNGFSHQSFIARSVFKGRLRGNGQAIGRLQRDDQLVAVKMLDPIGVQRMFNEIEMLSPQRHPNIINLIGFCIEDRHNILVHEYMPLVSLNHCLHARPLDWDTRMEIATGVARALNYLHDIPIIFANLKSTNVLLDQGFHPKLSDFGNATCAARACLSHGSTFISGNSGYWPPEYTENKRITLKGDVYSFGILLLEIITRRKAFQGDFLIDWLRPRIKGRDVDLIADPHMDDEFSRSMFVKANLMNPLWTLLPPMIKGEDIDLVADPYMNNEFSRFMVDKALLVALMCIRRDPNLRPTIKDVMLAMVDLNDVKYNPKERISSEGRRLSEGLERTSSDEVAWLKSVNPYLMQLLGAD